MATHFSILAWASPSTKWSMVRGVARVVDDLVLEEGARVPAPDDYGPGALVKAWFWFPSWDS